MTTDISDLIYREEFPPHADITVSDSVDINIMCNRFQGRALTHTHIHIHTYIYTHTLVLFCMKLLKCEIC
jgi:hypothetical protein